MLRRLKAGEFDDRAFPPPPQAAPPVSPATRQQADEPPAKSPSLDEIILEYLITGEKK
jgi:hypothetical protein